MSYSQQNELQPAAALPLSNRTGIFVDSLFAFLSRAKSIVSPNQFVHDRRTTEYLRLAACGCRHEEIPATARANLAGSLCMGGGPGVLHEEPRMWRAYAKRGRNRECLRYLNTSRGREYIMTHIVRTSLVIFDLSIRGRPSRPHTFRVMLRGVGQRQQ